MYNPFNTHQVHSLTSVNYILFCIVLLPRTAYEPVPGLHEKARGRRCLTPSDRQRSCLHKNLFQWTHRDAPVVSTTWKIWKWHLIQKKRSHWLVIEKKSRLTGGQCIVIHAAQSLILSRGGLLVGQLQLGKS